MNHSEKTVKKKRLLICADGASMGNPGLAAIGATVKDEQGRLITSISRSLGRTTNNQAEYMALIIALNEAVMLGAREVDIKMDSQLVVRQITGEYRVKDSTLKILYQKVRQLLDLLESFTITHIPREQNTEADSLANQALK